MLMISLVFKFDNFNRGPAQAKTHHRPQQTSKPAASGDYSDDDDDEETRAQTTGRGNRRSITPQDGCSKGNVSPPSVFVGRADLPVLSLDIRAMADVQPAHYRKQHPRVTRLSKTVKRERVCVLTMGKVRQSLP